MTNEQAGAYLVQLYAYYKSWSGLSSQNYELAISKAIAALSKLED